MTGGFQEETQAWIKRRGVRYPYAYDLDRSLVRPFDIFTLPHAILVDPRGVVVFSGPSKDLSDALIRKTLEGAIDQPSCDWPEAAAPAVGALRDGDLARALALAPLLAAADPGLKDLPRRVGSLIEVQVRAAEQLQKNGQLVSADRVATALKEQLTDPALKARLNFVLAEVAKVAKVKEIMTAERRALEILDGPLKDKADGHARLVELAALISAWPGSSAERAARAATNVLKRTMEQMTE